MAEASDRLKEEVRRVYVSGEISQSEYDRRISKIEKTKPPTPTISWDLETSLSLISHNLELYYRGMKSSEESTLEWARRELLLDETSDYGDPSGMAWFRNLIEETQRKIARGDVKYWDPKLGKEVKYRPADGRPEDVFNRELRELEYELSRGIITGEQFTERYYEIKGKRDGRHYSNSNPAQLTDTRGRPIESYRDVMKRDLKTQLAIKLESGEIIQKEHDRKLKHIERAYK